MGSRQDFRRSLLIRCNLFIFRNFGSVALKRARNPKTPYLSVFSSISLSPSQSLFPLSIFSFSLPLSVCVSLCTCVLRLSVVIVIDGWSSAIIISRKREPASSFLSISQDATLTIGRLRRRSLRLCPGKADRRTCRQTERELERETLLSSKCCYVTRS